MGKAQYIVIVVLAMAVAALGTALIVKSGSEGPPSPLSGGVAFAQDSAASQASYMLGLVGPLYQNIYVPYVLVDTRKQTILVYRFNTSQNQFQFVQARTYQYDTQCQDFPMRSVAPTIVDVRDFVNKMRGGAP
jgi:hypothetical protein